MLSLSPHTAHAPRAAFLSGVFLHFLGVDERAVVLKFGYNFGKGRGKQIQGVGNGKTASAHEKINGGPWTKMMHGRIICCLTCATSAQKIRCSSCAKMIGDSGEKRAMKKAKATPAGLALSVKTMNSGLQQCVQREAREGDEACGREPVPAG